MVLGAVPNGSHEHAFVEEGWSQRIDQATNFHAGRLQLFFELFHDLASTDWVEGMDGASHTDLHCQRAEGRTEFVVKVATQTTAFLLPCAHHPLSARL